MSSSNAVLRRRARVAQLLHKHGYGAGHSVTAAAVDAGAWKQCPLCEYIGAPDSIRNHLNRHHRTTEQ